MPRLIGLTGTPQSGKIELRNVFRGVGITFVNLNNVGNALRAIGGPLRARITAFQPAVLYDDGRRKAPYYSYMATQPELLAELTEAERVAILEQRPWEAHDGVVVVSWEFLHLLFDDVSFDHLIVLEPDRRVWFDRLRQRALDRGWEHDPPTDGMLERLLGAHGFVHGQMGSQWPDPATLHHVDTSGDDWGAPNLIRTLTSIGLA